VNIGTGVLQFAEDHPSSKRKRGGTEDHYQTGSPAFNRSSSRLGRTTRINKAQTITSSGTRSSKSEKKRFRPTPRRSHSMPGNTQADQNRESGDDHVWLWGERIKLRNKLHTQAASGPTFGWGSYSMVRPPRTIKRQGPSLVSKRRSDSG